MAMSRAAEWSGPRSIAATEPFSPYAHFAFQDQYSAVRAPTGAPGCYHSSKGCMIVRHAPVKGCHIETCSSVSDELARELGPLDRIVGIQLPDGVVNPNLTGLGGATAASAKSADPWPPEIPKPGTGHRPVFIGIVDDAIAFAHQRFRLPNGRTRFDYLWLQGVRRREGDLVPCGREFNRAQIDDLLDGRGEAAVYREVGLIDMRLPWVQHVAQAFSHGTAVLDAAAGYPPGAAEAAARPIAAVCLPAQVTSDTLGTFVEEYVILGLERLLAHLEHRREQVAGMEVPAVINISMALTRGPKDGSSLLDSFIERTTRTHAPLCYVLPAGNHRLSRTHAHFDLSSPPPFKTTWRLPPDDLTPSFLEIWGPAKAGPPSRSLKIKLSLPGSSEALTPTLTLDTYQRLVAGSRELAWVYCQWVAAPDGRGRERITVVTFPTRAAPGRASPAGDWRIEIDPGPEPSLPIEVYVQRDDTIGGFRRRGRQSYLVDAGYADRLSNGFRRLVDRGEHSPVRRSGTISSFATGPAQVVVGGRYASSRRKVWYSGAPEPGGRAVARFAASERSPVLRGVVAAGSASGSRVAIGGTSIAAAQVTRQLVDAFGRD
jgi:hypothetical protein